MFHFDDFTGLTLVQLGARFYGKELETINFLRRNDLLSSVESCPSCGTVMELRPYSRSIDANLGWRCPVQRCRRIHSVRKGSFFYQSKLKLWQILGLSIEWSKAAGSSRGDSYDNIAAELEIGCKGTIVDWNQFCRDICVEYFVRNPCKLGGPGRTVEIDESLFAKRKYNRGRVVAKQWIFGGYDRATKQGFLVAVPDRTAETLE